jgi:hypothetical protein
MAEYMRVECLSHRAICGDYKKGGKDRYMQQDGIHLLARHSTGQWGIGDGKVYLALAKQSSDFPDTPVTWQVLVNNTTYQESPTTKIYAMEPQHIEQDISIENSDWRMTKTATGSIVYQNKVTKEQRSTRPAIPAERSPITQTAPFVEKVPYVERKEHWVQVTKTNGTVVFRNTQTKVETPTVPEILLNVSAYFFETEQKTGVGVYAPLAMVQESGAQPTDLKFMESWRKVEAHWSKTLEILEGEMGQSQHVLEGLKKSGRVNEEERLTLVQTIARMQTSLQSAIEKERETNEELEIAQTALPRAPYIRRDEPAPSGARTFPTGEELQNEYAEVFGDSFEEATGQARLCMEDMMSMRDSTEFFVYDVIAPLFKVTKEYVTDMIAAKYAVLSDCFSVCLEEEEEEAEGVEDWEVSIARKFFLSSQQEVLLSTVMAADYSVINQLLTKMGRTVTKLRDVLPTWAAREGCPLVFDLTELVRFLLRVHTVIELSDPKCYLYPDVAIIMSYPDDRRIFREIFSPGVKRYGKLTLGEEVQVVVPGLYFQPPVSYGPPPEGSQALVIPVAPARVRRTLSAFKGGNHK